MRPGNFNRRDQIKLPSPDKKCPHGRPALLVGPSPLEPMQYFVAIINARSCFMVADECDRIGQGADDTSIPHRNLRLNPKICPLDHNSMLSTFPI